VGRVIHAQTVIAHHLILFGYGHWLPNDLRASGSDEVRIAELRDLAPIHRGRKRKQPSRNELREFHRAAEERLTHAVLWFVDSERSIIGSAVRGVVVSRGYTVWECTVLRDHVHLCVRIHRDSYKRMWELLTDATRKALLEVRPDIPVHPVWAERPYSVYLHTPDEVWRAIEYIRGNPRKHGLPDQRWDFVREYDNWPRHKKR